MRPTNGNLDFAKKLAEDDEIHFFRGLGEQLGRDMSSAGVTIVALSSRAHLSQGYIQHMLRGDVRCLGPYLRCFRILHRRVTFSSVTI